MYLIDEDGGRWDAEERDQDTAGLCVPGVEVRVGLKVKTKLVLKAREPSSGRQFTILGSQVDPMLPKQVVIPNVGSREATQETTTQQGAAGEQLPTQRAITHQARTEQSPEGAIAQQSLRSGRIAPPHSMGSMAAPEKMSFMLRHRHFGFLSTSTRRAEEFCFGTLSVVSDGSIRFDCVSTNDPSGRCDHVYFSPGLLKEVKIGPNGSLHLASKKQGNVDFFGDPNTIRQAHAAVARLIQK